MSQALSTAVVPRPVDVSPRRTDLAPRPTQRAAVVPGRRPPMRPAGSTVRTTGTRGAVLVLDVLSLLVVLVFVVVYAVVALALLAGRLVGRWARRALETQEARASAWAAARLSPSPHRP